MPATAAAAYFQAATAMRSPIPAERLAAVGALFDMARGYGAASHKAYDLLAGEFGPAATAAGAPAGGCAASHEATRVCEALGWDCRACPWAWPTLHRTARA